MTNTRKVGEDTVVELAKIIGYDQQNATEIERFKTRLSEMDLWDISKIIFFGRTWEKY